MQHMESNKITTPSVKKDSTQRVSINLSWVWVGSRTLLIYALLFAFSFFFMFPLVWMGGTSLKSIDEIGEPQTNLIPENPQWENYEKLFNDDSFYLAYMNSIFVVTVALSGSVISISAVAFAFSRLQWKGRNLVFFLMLGTLMLPYQATLVPQYVLFFELGWLQSFNPITIPSFFAGGAALIFLLRQFMLTLPKEIDEAAYIDGANPLQIWWYITLPLSRPAIATVTVFLFVAQWNSLLQPLIYLQRAALYTLPIFVAQKNNLQESPISWNDIMAASLMSIIPVMVVFILTQRYFTESIVLTGTKG